MTVPNVPKWAIYAGGAVALYLVWRAVTNPEGLGASVGAGAVGVVGGAIKGVGSGFKGAIDGVVQGITGDDTSTLGTGIYDFEQWMRGKLGFKTESDALKTPPYVPKPKQAGESSISDYIAQKQAGSPINAGGLASFSDGINGGGFMPFDPSW